MFKVDAPSLASLSKTEKLKLRDDNIVC